MRVEEITRNSDIGEIDEVVGSDLAGRLKAKLVRRPGKWRYKMQPRRNRTIEKIPLHSECENAA